MPFNAQKLQPRNPVSLLIKWTVRVLLQDPGTNTFITEPTAQWWAVTSNTGYFIHILGQIHIITMKRGWEILRNTRLFTYSQPPLLPLRQLIFTDEYSQGIEINHLISIQNVSSVMAIALSTSETFLMMIMQKSTVICADLASVLLRGINPWLFPIL